jgi:hypothetical protein
MRIRTSAIFGLILLLSTASAFGAICTRTTRAGLSSLAEAVLHNIETTPGRTGSSPVPLAKIQSSATSSIRTASTGRTSPPRREHDRARRPRGRHGVLQVGGLRHASP